MDPEAFEDLISCRVCYDVFNEDNRRPRILNCGHSFCHSCLEAVLRSRPLCPVCKADIKFTNVGLVPINFIVKDLISGIGLNVKDGAKFKICKSSETSNCRKRKSKKRLDSLYLHPKGFETYRYNEKKYLNDLQNPSIPKRPPKRIKSYYSRNKKTSESSLLTFASQQVGLNQIAGLCVRHKNECNFRCVDCEMWICDICSTTSNHGRCKSLPAEDYLGLKKRMCQKIEKQLIFNTKLSKKISKSLNILNIKNKSLLIEINNREIKLRQNSNRIKELESKKLNEVEILEKLKNLQNLVENSTNDKELFMAKMEIERIIDHQKNHSIKHEKKQSLLKLCKTESVYVVEGRLYGRVSIRQEKILISNFNSIKPTAKLISFRRLLCTLTGTTSLPTKVFLQLIPLSHQATSPNESGTDIENLDIVIDTNKSSRSATDFVLSCTGLKEQSYKGKTLIYSSSGYAMNLGLSTAIVGSSSSHHQSYSRSEGQVLGAGNLGLGFRINLEPLKYQPEFPLGKVLTGFQTLKSVRRNSLVKDCGIVISL